MNEMDEVLKLREQGKRDAARLKMMRAILVRELGGEVEAHQPCLGAQEGGMCPAHALLYIIEHEETADAGVAFRDAQTGELDVVQRPDPLGFGGLGLMMPPAEC